MEHTVDNLFDIAAVKVEKQPAPAVVAWCSIESSPPRISFNSEYGYIQYYDLGNCPKSDFGGGLMCPAISDCVAGMSINNFQPLPES